MRSLVAVSFLLLLMAGCQNQQSQVNPFAVYGPQRLPPPGTQTYGQPAQTAPYYQAPANQAPTINGGYQTNPPAQFTPPPNTAPTTQPPSSYGQQQWRSVSESSPSGSPSGGNSGSVVPASYTEEVNLSTSTGSSASSPSTTIPSGTSNSSSSTNPYMRGMHVNDLTEVAPVSSAPSTTLAPPATATMPNANWSTPSPTAYSNNASGSVSPSRIP